jgi:methionyl-tRNA formyltransferase
VRIVFFGSPREAIPALHVLLDAGHEVSAVYTRPDAIAGRSKLPEATPMKAEALRLGLHVETPDSLRGGEAAAKLASLGASAFVVAAYGRILPPTVLALPQLGALNIHPSLLPRHRGPSPVATAILEGDPVTGASIMLLDEGVDTGPLLAQSDPVAIGPHDTAVSLTVKLFETGAAMLAGTLAKWERKEIAPVQQDDSRATTTRLLKRTDGLIDWSRDAAYIERMTRAYHPWPGAFTRWDGRILKLIEVEPAGPGNSAPDRPGSRRRLGTATRTRDGFEIACGDGVLVVKRAQLEGRSAVGAAEFVRGYPAIDGSVLN